MAKASPLHVGRSGSAVCAMSVADTKREEGNIHFKARDFLRAELCYADALALLTADAAAAPKACTAADSATATATVSATAWTATAYATTADIIIAGASCNAIANVTATSACTASAEANAVASCTTTEVKCRLNRATCLLKLEGYAAALRESAIVLALDPANAKAHYRRAQALRGITLTDTPRAHPHTLSLAHVLTLALTITLVPLTPIFNLALTVTLIWNLTQAQVLEADFRFGAAQEAFTAAIRAGPSLREPRTALSSLCARLKAFPRLQELVLDLALVEERAIRSLNLADIARV